MTSSPKIISRNNGKLVIEIDIESSDSLLQEEENIMNAVNSIGAELTGDALKRHDLDSDTIILGDVLAYSKGQSNGVYQTPYGSVDVQRHVYQTSKGGKIIVPLEMNCKMVDNTTPKFAKQVSSKYISMSASDVISDLADNHGRQASRSFIQNVVSCVGTEIESSMADGQWTIVPTVDPSKVKSISCGLDGAMMPVRGSKDWREAMAGTIAFFDEEGTRLETIYVAAAPEYGKELFTQRFLNSIEQAKTHVPDAAVIGLADGAHWNWGVLSGVTDIQLLDFYHVSEYLADVAEAMFPDENIKKEKYAWLKISCHNLKHKKGAAKRLLNEMNEYREGLLYLTKRAKILDKVITYFTNGYKKMNYYKHCIENYPIGSGVTEAACKVIIKQRMCKSGSRWSIPSAEKILIMRCMSQTGMRWNEYWENR
jgi:hypothetical protein